MSEKEWVVRVVMSREEIERRHFVFTPTPDAQLHRDDRDGICYDLHCPFPGPTYEWAVRNAEKIRSYGWNAVHAPAWPRESSE